MSTPTTLNPAHHQYPLPHQANYPATGYYSNGQMNGSTRQTAAYFNGYAANATSDSDLRRAATSNSRHSNQLPPIQTHPSPMANNAYSSADAAMRKDNKRKPDWNEFYKNGVPHEIIVIDDDTPPPSGARRQNGYASQHTDKRQRTGNQYDPVYNQTQTSYSATQTPYYENSASTDRTTSAYVTTAPTSLGSTTSTGTYNLPPLEDGTVGQKRKRTRAQIADDTAGPAKRREVERLTPPHLVYEPPKQPIIKAKEVHVEVIRDVCGCTPSKRRYCAHTKQKQNANDRFDDEDGHYNVVAGANLTDRCGQHVWQT